MAIEKISKIFLVNSAQSPLSYLPTGVAFLAGICEKINVDYKTLDLNVEFFNYTNQDIWDQVLLHIRLDKTLSDLPPETLEYVDKFIDHSVNIINEYNPDCVAITLLTFVQQHWAERFLTKLRKTFKGKIIAGGPGISTSNVIIPNSKILFGEYLANNNLIDYYVLGEGDLIFEQFLLGERNLLGLNDKNLHNSWQPQLDNLDLYATPSYKQISFEGYNTHDAGKYKINVTSSRGCVRRCTFCDVGNIWKKFRYRSGENVAQEILKHHKEIGATNIWFTDSLINGSLKQFKDLISKLVEYKNLHPSLADLTYNGQFIVRPKNTHNEEMFKLMHDSGCTHLQVGIESGSESVREHMGKKFTNEDIEWHLEMCEKYKIKNTFLMITGYPTETEEDHQATKDLLIKSQKYAINHTIVSVNLQYALSILPNTPLEAMMPDLGIHYTDISHGSYANWFAESNKDLTIPRRHQRLAELVELALNLRYNLPTESLYYLKKNINAN